MHTHTYAELEWGMEIELGGGGVSDRVGWGVGGGGKLSLQGELTAHFLNQDQRWVCRQQSVGVPWYELLLQVPVAQPWLPHTFCSALPVPFPESWFLWWSCPGPALPGDRCAPVLPPAEKPTRSQHGISDYLLEGQLSKKSMTQEKFMVC